MLELLEKLNLLHFSAIFGTLIRSVAWRASAVRLKNGGEFWEITYVRWGIGPTDDGWNLTGWNIDDVELIDTSDPVVMAGDFVHNCQVDTDDLSIMMNHWLDMCGDCEGTDLNTDGSVTFEDFSLFAQHWLEGV